MEPKSESRLWFLWDASLLGSLFLFGIFNCSFPVLFYVGPVQTAATISR